MKAKLLVVMASVIMVVAFSTVASFFINLSFVKDINLYNVLLATAVCTPVISLFVGKNTYDFYKEEIASRRKVRFVAKKN